MRNYKLEKLQRLMTDWLVGFREETKRIREKTKQIGKEVERLRKENEALRSITPKKLSEIVQKSINQREIDEVLK